MPSLPLEQIRFFCQKWPIQTLAVFGSAITPRFNEKSDIDLLVTLDSDSTVGLFQMVQMQRELSTIVGRPVDLVSRKGIEASRNPIRRQEILSTAQTIYEK